MKNQGLFNLDSKEINPNWVDPNSPLKIPENPLHFSAHKLQLLLDRLDNQAATNAAQFNSKNYLEILKEWNRLLNLIKDGKTKDEEILDKGNVAADGDASPTEEDSDVEPIGMDS